MGIAPYLKEIARGREGARSLDEIQARDLFEQVLDQRVSAAEMGGFALAMRIKGESVAELAAFTAVAAERSLVLAPPSPPVLLPSYNGARKLPNLTALLALLLAQEGVPVLVHGPASDPARITTHELFVALGLPIAHDAAAVHDAWSRHEPVFVPTGVMCPALLPLLELRWQLGLRNSAHTVAKLLMPRWTAGPLPSPAPDPAMCDPAAPAGLRVVNYTHPEYGGAHTQFLQHTGAHALLLRGTEGEPVADPRRLPKMDVFIGGILRPELGRAALDGVLTELPLLPRTNDAATTAVYIQAVVSGEKPAPGPLLEQVEVLVRARRALQQWQGATHERSA